MLAACLIERLDDPIGRLDAVSTAAWSFFAASAPGIGRLGAVASLDVAPSASGVANA